MFVTRATAFGDSARLNIPGLGEGEPSNGFGDRFGPRRILALAYGVKWFLAIVSTVLIACIDFAAGSAASFSFLYLVPIAFSTLFIRVWAGVAVAIVSVLAWLLVEFLLGTDYSIPPAHLASEAVRFGLSIAGVALLALWKRSTGQLSREIASRTQSLRLEAERCRRLEQEVVNASAREQLRLAQDLHDGIGQYISALTFLSKMLADDLHLHDSAQAAQADRIVALVRKTNQVTRQLNLALRIPALEGGGLPVALRTLATEVEQLTGVHCEISSDREIPLLDEFRTMMLFRIAQEAFNNCVKHARPRLIRVSLTFAREVLYLSVINDGHGAGGNRGGEPGSGSQLMKLRAELIGAHLETGPISADEFQVQCVLPLTRPKAYAVAE